MATPDQMRKTTSPLLDMSKLHEIGQMIEEGDESVIVSMSLTQAAQVFRISRERFQQMAERRQEFRLWLDDKKEVAYVQLGGSKSRRTQDYNFLYGLLQTTFSGQVDAFLNTQKPTDSLMAEVPGLEQAMGVIESGVYPSHEDLGIMHMYLTAMWIGLGGNQSEVDHPKNVLSSTCW